MLAVIKGLVDIIEPEIKAFGLHDCEVAVIDRAKRIIALIASSLPDE